MFLPIVHESCVNLNIIGDGAARKPAGSAAETGFCDGTVTASTYMPGTYFPAVACRLINLIQEHP
jgi:hypothetical protein